MAFTDDPLHERLYRQAAALEGRPLDHRVPFRSIAEAHGDATLGSLLLMLAAPCLIPIPGAGSLFSLGLMLLAVAMWRGQLQGNGVEFRWPQRIDAWSLPPAAARKLLHGLAWMHARGHRWCRPRWDVFHHPAHRHWMAAWVAAMAVLILLPIPFGNVLPAVALMSLGVGLIHRDGMAVGAGLAVGVAALVGVGFLGVWVGTLGENLWSWVGAIA